VTQPLVKCDFLIQVIHSIGQIRAKATMRRRDFLLGTGTLVTRYGLSASAANPAAVWSTDGIQDVEFQEDQSVAQQEPDFELAKLWWPDQRNVWTPIGWKDHYFRFNVLYNGTIICEPCPHWTPPRPHAVRWLGQSFQLNFVPPFSRGQAPSGLPTEPTQLWRLDSGHGIQGWREDKQTPVLWTEYRLQQGLIVRQEVFAHIKGGSDVQTGIEPIYAWIRLSVTHVDELRAPENIAFDLQLSRVYYGHDGRYVYEDGVAISVDSKLAAYPKKLRAETSSVDSKHAINILEPDGKVRMIASAPSTGDISLTEVSTGIYALNVKLDGKVDARVDILVPMLAEEKMEITQEYSLGFDNALAQCEPYWSRKPATAAVFHVPEEHINRAIEQSVKFAQLIAEKDYVSGEYTFLTGSWAYDNLWSTPTSMTSHMFLDTLGYGECVARHIEIFRLNQGSVKPPGPTYTMDPGYLSTPKSLTAFNWLTDHGAILHQASTHGLLTNDREFIERWTEPIVKACDFIQTACARTNHGGVDGLLPPAVASDELIPTQAVWNIAWTYKGLASAVRLLTRMNHPRASEFATFAARQKEIFVKAFREQAAKMPRWTDASGKRHPKVPTTLSTTATAEHIFGDLAYLDVGPMVLVWAGLMDASDELMQASVQFFREGPNTKLYGYRPDPLDRAVLIHEISSGEPCYSWNTFHSWQLGDRERFLEGLYSLFAGALSLQTYIGCEHRHGVQGNIFPMPMAFTLARLSVIDDEIVPGELHLLRLCPKAWVSSQQESIFEKMPTLFGTVNLRFKLSPDGKSLDISFKGQWRETPRKVVLHIPPVSGISHVIMNGRRQVRRNVIELTAL
jgi:hypothetical protein